MPSLEEILTEIRKLYNKNPLDWKISVNRDSFNHGNILVSNPNFKTLWQIKLDSLFKPKPLGIGAKIKNIDFGDNFKSSNIPSFGYRPLLDEQLGKLQSNILEKKPVDSLILEILETDPIAIKNNKRQNTKRQSFIEGPVTFTPPGYISKKQKELDRKLKRDLERLKYGRGLGLQYI